MTLQPLIPILLFGAALTGAGALLAPALGQKGRTLPVGLAAALALALVTVVSLALAALAAWRAPVVDALALLVLVGCAGAGWLARRGGETGSPPTGRMLAFFPLALALFTAPVLTLPVPLDTDAQGFGYLALMLRESGSLTTLTPFHPEIEYLYSPGFPALAAYLSQRLGGGLHAIQFAAAAVLAALLVWGLWDFGEEAAAALAPGQSSRRAGAALAGAGLLGLGLFTAYMDSHYTTIMALVFALAFLTCVARYLRGGRWSDALAAAVALAAVPLTHPDTTIILVLGYVPWLGTIWLSQERPALRRWLVIAGGIPLAALLLILPWLARIAPLLGSEIASPFEIDPNHWRVLVFMQGGLIVPLALGGAVLAARRRAAWDVMMLGWLLLVIDFSTTGLLERVTFGLLDPLLKYDYPFSIAWHGPIIPYAYLGGTAILWLARRFGAARRIERLAWPALGIAALGIALGVALAEPLRDLSKGRIGFFGAFASAADVQALTWLRENTPPEARLLNFPGPQEGDWAPIISERDTVFFRPQPFFQHTEQAEAEQAALYGFWQDPADPAWADRLRAAGVTYVIVPQVVGNPESYAGMWRWREPFAWELERRSDVSAAPYLELAIDFDGAQVWRVR